MRASRTRRKAATAARVALVSRSMCTKTRSCPLRMRTVCTVYTFTSTTRVADTEESTRCPVLLDVWKTRPGPPDAASCQQEDRGEAAPPDFVLHDVWVKRQWSARSV
ncbi:hypothetical protein MRX96_031981 [Rhipicephalus microplus]